MTPVDVASSVSTFIICIFTHAHVHVYLQSTCARLPSFQKNTQHGSNDCKGIRSRKEIGCVNILPTCIRESVDSLCRDDADMPMPPYIRKACNRPNAAFVSLFR